MSVERLGVVGAGTMGAGIAQLGCAAGMRTVLHDPVPEALERGTERVGEGLAKWAEKGRVGDDAAGLLATAEELGGLADCELVIEAAPERFDLKRELFEQLSEICGEGAVLATNTSSIPVTSLAGAASKPENVVGMHFFNPPPLMQLVEVIRADQSADAAVAVAREVGEAMGKRVIMATDGPGFLVNRSGRPFASEALRLVQERIATPEQVDRICRLEGGFRMGPFELMDLVGIDVNLEVAKSFAELSFGEPRWRPNPLQARMVAAGRLGRKSGRGWYEYEDGKPRRPEDPDPPAPGDGDGRALAIHGDGPLAAGLRQRAAQAGFRVGGEEDAELIIDARPAKREAAGRGKAGAAGAPEAGAAAAGAASAAAAADAPPLLLCAGSSLAARRAPGAVGFHLLPPLDGCRLVELTGERESEQGRMAERLFGALGFVTEWVGDAPGLVLGRIVCQLVNEACFAIGEGVGSAADVDAGLELGLNHPRGPVAWAEAISIPNVLAVIDGLWEERHEERYRAAPLLRRAAATGTLG